MTLLEHYLFAVGGYLEKHAEKHDVLAELAEHLQTRIDERAVQLGRKLSESEEKRLLAEYGDPFVVAGRYGTTGPGFSFGPLQIISPTAFPGYAWALVLVIITTLIGTTLGGVLDGSALGGILRRLVISVSAEFILVTVIFAGIDRFLVRHREESTPTDRLDTWLFWSPYAARIPHWYSAAGLAVLAIVTLWWATAPAAPTLIFGSAAATLMLSPVWLHAYWPVMTLLSVGMAQRVANLLRPDLLWLLPAMRLLTNIAALALLYPLLNGDPFVLVRGAVPLTAHAAALAASTDATLRGLLRAMEFYWFFNALWLLWVGLQHLRHFGSRAQNASPCLND